MKRQYRTAEKEKKKTVKLKYPLQPFDAVDKWHFASMLGDLRREIERHKSERDSLQYTLNNLFRSTWTKEEIADMRQELAIVEQRIINAQQVHDKHEQYTEYLMSWEEALDTLKTAVERGKGIEKNGKTFFVAEGRFERKRFERAIASVAPIERYADIETADGEYWIMEVKLLPIVYNWLEIRKVDEKESER